MAAADSNMHIYIDVSEFYDKLMLLRDKLGDNKAEQVLFWTIKKTERDTKKILKTDLPKEYIVKPKPIASATGNGKYSRSGSGVSCTIPLSGKKFTVGGKHIDAIGGGYGWPIALAHAGKPYPIHAKILKGKGSELPKHMKHQGGNPPFRNVGAKKLNNAVFTRKGKGRFPIESVSALAVPQMPMNLSRDKVTDDIYKALDKYIDYYFQRMI